MSATQKTAQNTADAAKDGAQAASAAANDGVTRMTEGMSRVGSFGQETMEAVTASASIVAKGMERAAQENVAFAKSQMEHASERMKAFQTVKTPQEFFEAQANVFRTVMEAQIEQTNKVSDLMIETARDAAQPLSKRYSAMVEMMQAR